jgi:hypothetical protein
MKQGRTKDKGLTYEKKTEKKLIMGQDEAGTHYRVTVPREHVPRQKVLLPATMSCTIIYIL